MLTTRVIIEMLGAPKEHVQNTLKTYIEKWKDDGIKIQKEHYEEPKEDGKMFRAFVELEIQFNNAAEVMGFCLDALPASVEVIEPERFEQSAHGLNGILNDMVARLHETDMVVKNLRSQIEVIDRNALNTFRNFIRYAAKESKSLHELSELVKVQPDQLKPFLDKMLEENLLSLTGDKYSC